MKYKHFKGKWRNQNVYGLSFCEKGKPIIICEGSIDAIRLWELGVRNSVAILGASPSLKQMQLIAQVSDGAPIYIMGDGDDAGATMSSECRDILSTLGISATEVRIREKDPDSLTRKALLEYIGDEFKGFR